MFPTQLAQVILHQWLLCQFTKITAFALLIESTGMTGRESLQAIRLLDCAQHLLQNLCYLVLFTDRQAAHSGCD